MRVLPGKCFKITDIRIFNVITFITIRELSIKLDQTILAKDSLKDCFQTIWHNFLKTDQTTSAVNTSNLARSHQLLKIYS